MMDARKTVETQMPSNRNVSLRVFSSLEALRPWAQGWRQLVTDCGSGWCSTFEYIEKVWRHFASPNDKLLVLVLVVDGALRGVAPLYKTIIRLRGIPTRVVQWIAVWEGDKPSLIVSREHERDFWMVLERYFTNTDKAWDVIKLCEQIREPRNGLACQGIAGNPWKVSLDGTGFSIDIGQGFDAYLAGIDAKVRSNWRNRHKKLFGMTPSPRVTCLSAPGDQSWALARFVQLEALSWKVGAHQGLSKDEAHLRFYADLADDLAKRGEVYWYFLTQEDKDVAASLFFGMGEVLYERQIVFDPAFSSYSPGILLRCEVLKQVAGTHWKTVDLMGMHPGAGAQKHKSDWATSQYSTYAWLCFRPWGRLWPMQLMRRIKSAVRKPAAEC